MTFAILGLKERKKMMTHPQRLLPQWGVLQSMGVVVGAHSKTSLQSIPSTGIYACNNKASTLISHTKEVRLQHRALGITFYVL